MDPHKNEWCPPLAIATYRLVFSTFILLPFYVRSGGFNRLLASSFRDLLSLATVGVVLAIHFGSWITSLSLTSVASSVLFVHVDPIFVAVVSHFYLKERIARGTLVGITLAFLGASTIAFSDAGVSDVSLLGDFLALIGALMLGFYILAGRRLRQSLNLVSYVTPVYAFSAVTLALASLAGGTSLWPYPQKELLLFLMIALVPMIFGHTVYNWTLKWLSAPLVSISLLGEPVGATILAYIFFDEVPSILALSGGALILLGICLCVRSAR
ncbi:MAG: DMT family transporter [Candidatus Bathyarchaeota archaeon]|nr:DMT family transporter [Candidatus Bathyarchaeota archaeon]